MMAMGLPRKRTTLASLMPCEAAVVSAVGGPPPVATRLRDMGFREGVVVEMVKQAPLADPIEFRVEGTHVSLRRTEAALVEVRDVRPVPCSPGGRGWGRGRGRGFGRGRRRGWLKRFWGRGLR